MFCNYLSFFLALSQRCIMLNQKNISLITVKNLVRDLFCVLESSSLLKAFSARWIESLNS